MASLVWRTAWKRKNKKKLKKNKKTSRSEETVRAKVREALREVEVKLRWVEFVKQVGFKPEVKERRSDG